MRNQAEIIVFGGYTVSEKSIEDSVYRVLVDRKPLRNDTEREFKDVFDDTADIVNTFIAKVMVWAQSGDINVVDNKGSILGAYLNTVLSDEEHKTIHCSYLLKKNDYNRFRDIKYIDNQILFLALNSTTGKQVTECLGKYILRDCEFRHSTERYKELCYKYVVKRVFLHFNHTTDGVFTISKPYYYLDDMVKQLNQFMKIEKDKECYRIQWYLGNESRDLNVKLTKKAKGRSTLLRDVVNTVLKDALNTKAITMNDLVELSENFASLLVTTDKKYAEERSITYDLSCSITTYKEDDEDYYILVATTSPRSSCILLQKLLSRLGADTDDVRLYFK